MMVPTPQRIVDYLQNHAQASAYELSSVFHLTPVNIRHHINTLLQQGLIELASQKPTGGRGRPTLFYRLSQNALKNNYEALSRALLTRILEDQENTGKGVILERIAQTLFPNEPIQQSHNLTHRLNTLIHVLNENAYQAHWEARASGPVIYISHCPYASLLSVFPTELCQMDLCLITHLVGVPAKKVKPCTFALTSAVLT